MRRSKCIASLGLDCWSRFTGSVLLTNFESADTTSRKRGHDVVEERPIPVVYDGKAHKCGFRADLLVDQLVVVELKAKPTIHPIDKSQTLSHLRLMGLPVGLLINFHEVRLIDGLSRIVNNWPGPKPT